MVFIDQALQVVFDTILDRLATTASSTNDQSKKSKISKKTQITKDNYAELTKENLKQEFNEGDFLKNAFLQYMLYAFQIKLDVDNARNNK